MKRFHFSVFTTPVPYAALILISAALPGSLSAQGIRINPGTHLVMSGSPVLVLNNASLINDGKLAAGNGIVLFTGDGPQTTLIAGSVPIRFYNLTLRRSAADLRLDNDAAISGQITLDSGNLQLNGHNLDLGSTGSIIGERDQTRITGANGGTITLIAELNGPQALNPGNIGVEFTSAADLGTTLITRGHTQQTGAGSPTGAAGQTGIQRYYDINPESNAGLQASLRFYYFDGELAGNNKNELAIFSSEGLGQDWVSAGKDGYSASGNWVIKGGFDQLHRYTLAIPGSKQLAPATMSAAKIFPNPSHDVFTLSLTSGQTGRVALNLFDMAGQVLETKELYLQAGSNTLTWDIGKYPAGVYWLGLGSVNLRAAGFGTIKVVKQ